ncbi:MAG: alpha/beta fold hydrolase [Pseudomonadales bacterium]|nr:alpha/beta fold hydrolase [Pseudomonadales bacterium]
MTSIRPFTIEVSDEAIADLRARLARTRFPDRETPDDWSQGTPLAYMQELVRYWLHDYDHKRLANRLNAWPNFITEVDGLDIHFLHVRSSHANARPLVLTHGWPGSVVEFLKVIEPLTQPEKHGGSPADAFHLVMPSLAGYGWSGKPTAPGWGVQKMGSAWGKLMARLGYDSYFAQGGDWGAIVTSHVALQNPGHCKAIHLNMIVAPPDPATMNDLTPLEQSALAGLKHYQDVDSGYSKEQGTRPQTVGYGLVDSPAGLLGWIMEKFWAWTDCNGHPENVLTRDEMLDNIMVYWLNAAGASSARLYWESFGAGFADTVNTPMGGSVFPKEIFRASKRWAQQRYPNIIYWNELDAGGHFAAFEQPGQFVTEVRNCFREASL